MALNCHSELFAFRHSEGAERQKNLARDRLREESARDSSPIGLRMTKKLLNALINIKVAHV